MKNILLALLCASFQLFSHAQEKYSKATITASDGQNYAGFIRNTAYEGTPQQFDFTTQPDGKVVTYKAQDLQKVVFEDGATFERHVIKIIVINQRYLDRKLADYQHAANLLDASAMVEKVITGPVSLYQFVDRFGFPHFFYTTASDQSLTNLPNKIYTDERQVIKQDHSYKNLINFLVAGKNCESSIQRQTENLAYQLNPMIRLFKEINGCLGGNIELNNPEYNQKTKIRFGLMGGVSFTKLHLKIGNTSSYPGLTADHFEQRSIMPTIGAFIGFVPRKRSADYHASLELFYQAYKHETDSIQANAYTRGKGKAAFSVLNIAPTIRYMLMRRKTAPFIEGGVVVNYVISSKSDYTYVTTNNRFSRPLLRSGSTGYDFLLGAGLNFPKASAHFRYHLPLNKGGTYFSAFYAIAKINLKN